MRFGLTRIVAKAYLSQSSMDALTHTYETQSDRLAPVAARCDIVRHPAPIPTVRGFPHTIAATLFILTWTILNLGYLAFLCPHDLAPDEAHYWHWSRQLDWSYYSKGPLVAWLIRGSCELLGTNVLAVRLPAMLSSAALLAGLYVLIADVLRDRRLAFSAMVCAATMPAISAGAVLMTIDPPFLTCWCWALVGVRRALAIRRSSLRWWLLASICSALGVLAKYPMLLLPASAIGYLLIHRRREFRRPGIWVFLAITLLGCVPILVWNAGNEWVSFRHVLGQAGLGEPTPAAWFSPFAYVGGQIGILLGFWFAAFAAGVWRFRRTSDTGLSLMWWASVPVWGLFLLASVRTAGQVNWPAAAYIGGSVLAAAWIRDSLAGPHRRLVLRFLIATTALGITCSHWLRFPQVVRPTLARLTSSPSEDNPTPIRKLDPTARLQGWRTLAAEIDRIRDRVRRGSGHDPALAGMLWTLPGELSFYCRDHPPAYSFGSALADRHSQYDCWRPNPVADPELFRGRTFLYVGEAIPNFDEVFDRVEAPMYVTHFEAGIPIARWTVWVCNGYRGFPERRTRTGY